MCKKRGEKAVLAVRLRRIHFTFFLGTQSGVHSLRAKKKKKMRLKKLANKLKGGVKTNDEFRLKMV